MVIEAISHLSSRYIAVTSHLSRDRLRGDEITQNRKALKVAKASVSYGCHAPRGAPAFSRKSEKWHRQFQIKQPLTFADNVGFDFHPPR